MPFIIYFKFEFWFSVIEKSKTHLVLSYVLTLLFNFINLQFIKKKEKMKQQFRYKDYVVLNFDIFYQNSLYFL